MEGILKSKDFWIKVDLLLEKGGRKEREVVFSGKKIEQENKEDKKGTKKLWILGKIQH